MKTKDIVITAAANLMRSKLRTSLTILAIFIGAFTLTITSGIGSGISSYIDKQLGNLGADNVLLVRPSGDETASPAAAPQKYDPNKASSASAGFTGNTTVLTQVDLDKIAAHPNVVSATPLLMVAVDYIQGAADNKWQLTIAPSIRGTHLDLAAGQNVDEAATAHQIVLPITYLPILGYASPEAAVGQTVTLGLTNALGQSRQQPATIVGIQQKGILGGGGATIDSAFTKALYDIQTEGLPAATKDKYQMVSAQFKDGLGDAAVSALKTNLKKQGYTAETVQDQIGTIKTVIGGIIGVLNAFAVIALLAASFGIINTLLMAVQERTKEIGLMKSMGMGSGRIFMLFSAEAIMIGFWGSLLGVTVAFAVGTVASTILANGFLKDLPGLRIVAYPPESIAFIMLLIMTIAFLAGTLPARRAARLNPIDALRYE